MCAQLRGSRLHTEYEQAHTRFRYYIRSSVTCFYLLCSVNPKRVLHSVKNCAQKNLGKYLGKPRSSFLCEKNLCCGFVTPSTYTFNLVIFTPRPPEKDFKKNSYSPLGFRNLLVLCVPTVGCGPVSAAGVWASLVDCPHTL